MTGIPIRSIYDVSIARVFRSPATPLRDPQFQMSAEVRNTISSTNPTPISLPDARCVTDAPIRFSVPPPFVPNTETALPHLALPQ